MTLVAHGVVFCRSYDLVWIGVNCPTNHNELRNIESPFAEFELRHERLTLIDALPKLYLSRIAIQPRRLPLG